MTSIEGGPITVELPQGGFEAVQGVVAGFNKVFRTTNGPETNLNVKQEFMLQQVAAKGILNLMTDVNLAGASSLATELETKVAADPYTDMTAVELDAGNSLSQLNLELQEHQHILAEAEEEAEEEVQLSFDLEDEAPAEDDAAEEIRKHQSAILQLEEQVARQTRYVRLAAAVGATARATVVAVRAGSNLDAIQSSLARERKIVEAATEPVEVNGMIRHSTAIGSAAEAVLSSMLTKLENPPLSQIA